MEKREIENFLLELSVLTRKYKIGLESDTYINLVPLKQLNKVSSSCFLFWDRNTAQYEFKSI